MIRNVEWREAVMKTRLRVLAADDHEQCRWALDRLLGIAFEVVASVGDGRKVVDSAIALAPDVIVSDIAMPVLTGVEAMEALRAKGYNFPFVLVSTHNCGIEAYLARGAMAFVYKVDMGHDLVPAVFAAANGQNFVSRNALGLQSGSLRCA
jgi:DNA-binding NarL/FixJ family response regulator